MSNSRVLRIGLLGASRIAPSAICIPALVLSHKLVAVGSRNFEKSKVFADRWGIENVLQDYEALINHPEVDVVYNALPNSMHAKFNKAALIAGKQVISEKPFASNFQEAKDVALLAETYDSKIIEAFHYRYHPAIQRAIEIAVSGEIGEITKVFSALNIPAPGEEDLRWQYELSGGAMMDLGCYALHVQRHLSLSIFNSEPKLISAESRQKKPNVDKFMSAVLKYANGAIGQIACDMDYSQFESPLRITGTKGEIYLPSFVLPGVDDRVIISSPSGSRTEHLGNVSSYTWQLAAFSEYVQGAEVLTGIEDALANARAIDDIYSAAGMDLRKTVN
jgi:predicted dehydrogenase